MRPFSYLRPIDLSEAISILADHGEHARVLAGGTDLIIRLRDGTYAPDVVVDVKGIPEMAPSIAETGGEVRISAGTTMTDIHDNALIREWFPALADSARFVGSVQIRNRATLVGNQCNASPAADTAPPLLVYGARLVIAGPAGERVVALDDFFVRSGVTALNAGELVTAILLPRPAGPRGSSFGRRTRRRGHDLASVTVAVCVYPGAETLLAYGSLGPRPLLFESENAPDLETWFARAQPSPTSMRASPDYRLAMLRVLAEQALTSARKQIGQS